MNVSSRVRRLIDDIRTAATMPRVQVVLSRGRPNEEGFLERVRRRHPRYRVVSFKSVGAALLPLDEFADVDGYLANLRYARRRVLRASRRGYTLEEFDPSARHAELLAIHTSLPERQGQEMDLAYLDPDATYETGDDLAYLGVFQSGVLVAYSQLRYAGEVADMKRVMGHGDHLDDGVMYLLTAGIVEHLKKTRPDIRYVWYDMYFGAADGLRSFKTRLGFRPYYVRWKRELRDARSG